MRNAIVLAAGKGTRMKSDRSKVMHTIIDRSMLTYIIDALRAVSVQRIVMIVGYQAESIKEAFPDVEFALQQPQLGTGHAVMQATQLKDEDGDTLIINGDGPCIQPETLEKLFQTNQDASLTLLTSVLDDGAHYGRIVRDENGHVQAIVEAKDCTEEQKKICEINAGMYCFKNRDLFDNLDKLTTNNAQNEYYLTDLVKILANQGKVVKGLVVEDRDEVMGINDCVELNKAYEWMRNRINNNWMKEGVQIVDPKRTVKDFVEILPGSYLNNSIIENHAVVDSSKVVDSCISEGTVVGPMSYVSNNKTIK